MKQIDALMVYLTTKLYRIYFSTILLSGAIYLMCTFFPDSIVAFLSSVLAALSIFFLELMLVFELWRRMGK